MQQMRMLGVKPNLDQIASQKTLINIGAGLDIPTGFPVRGLKGQTIVNGGLGMLTAVLGAGNSFKSSLLDFMTACAASRIYSTCPTMIDTYDTEINKQIPRLIALCQRFDSFRDLDIIGNLWLVSDKTQIYGNQYYEKLKDFLAAKIKEYAKNLVSTPFPNYDKKPLMIMPPTFSQIDSFTEFETEDVAELQDKNELGDSGGNMIHMRQGAAKTRFMMDIPTEAGRGGHYVLMTAHIGKEAQIQQGPMPKAPEKKLSTFKNGDKAMGVTGKFYYLMSNCFQSIKTEQLINQGTRCTEYPRHPDDNIPLDPDLNVVHLRQLRSKSGPAGIVLEVVASQLDGILPSLTEFHIVKSADRFGLSGTMQHYAYDLLPDVKIGRTTVRAKLDENAQLRRVANITCELYQIGKYWRTFDRNILVSPKQLYEDLKALGYDWNVLLKTRGWWTVDDDTHPVPFLSTIDLLHMRLPKDHPKYYFPYWMNDDMTVKDQYKANFA